MKIWQDIEQHPYIAAGGVFVLGVILIVIFFSGNTSAPASAATQPNTDTANATQLAMAQLAAQVQSNATNAAAGVAAGQTAAQVQIAQTQAAAQGNSDVLASQTALGLAQIGLQQAEGVSTIQANVAQSEIAAGQTVDLATLAQGLAINGQNTSAAVQINAAQQTTQQLANQDALSLGTIQARTAANVAITQSSDQLQAHINDNSTTLQLGNINNLLQGAPVAALNAKDDALGRYLALHGT